jgi:GT2 family glycosyltransferase
MEPSKDLTICIVNWNTSDLLRDCLNSIFNNTWNASLEVIVVDNDSADSSVEMLKREFPQVNLIANHENVGFARANNQAIKQSHGKYILLLNSDTVVLPDSLDSMVSFMKSHPETGMVGCKLVNTDGSTQRSSWQGFPSLQSAVVNAFYLWRLLPNHSWVHSSEVSISEHQSELEVDHLLGACMLVRREVIDSVGGMDDQYFLFLEETEWCYRIKKKGWSIYYLPFTQIIHIGQQSVHMNPERNLPEEYRNFVRFYRNIQNPPKYKLMALKIVIASAAIIRIGLWIIRFFSTTHRNNANRMVRGYSEVIRQLPSY